MARKARFSRTGRPLGDDEFVAQVKVKQHRTLHREKPSQKSPRVAAASA